MPSFRTGSISTTCKAKSYVRTPTEQIKRFTPLVVKFASFAVVRSLFGAQLPLLNEPVLIIDWTDDLPRDSMQDIS
jgi:hypothetical protein